MQPYCAERRLLEVGFADSRMGRRAKLPALAASLLRSIRHQSSASEKVRSTAAGAAFQGTDTRTQQWGDPATQVEAVESPWAPAAGQAPGHATEGAPLYPQAYAEQGRVAQDSAPPLSYPAQVDPPPRCAWHHEHVNSVRLIGLVGAAPEVRHLGTGQVVAQVSLGLKPRFSRSRSVQRNWIRVDFWGYEALQVEQHVLKGMELAVGGHLKKDTWTTASGEDKSVVKVTAEYFQVVEPRVGTLVSDAVDSSDDSATSPETASAAAARLDSSPAANQQTKSARSKPASTKARATHKLWLENPGMSWGALADALLLTPERVVSHLVECACSGMETDITRLAAQLQIGYPNSPWMTVAELDAAINAAQQAAAAAGEPTDPETLRIKPVRSILAEHTSQTATKLLSQEQACGGALGLAVTYGQIKLRLASTALGFDLEGLAVEAPPPVSQLLDPEAEDAPAEPPF